MDTTSPSKKATRVNNQENRTIREKNCNSGFVWSISLISFMQSVVQLIAPAIPVIVAVLASEVWLWETLFHCWLTIAEELSDKASVEVAGVRALAFPFDIPPDETRLVWEEEGAGASNVGTNEGLSLPEERGWVLVLGGGVTCWRGTWPSVASVLWTALSWVEILDEVRSWPSWNSWLMSM